MMRRSRIEEEEEEEEEEGPDLVSSQKGTVAEKGTGQKMNPLRSKHSETEQRRRLKINERFQALMDLIPQNDQKRDKASFLLEVIQYIQFLQAKLDMYEGWSQEPSKLVPRRNSVGPVESFIDQPQVMRNGSGQADNYVVTPSVLINSQNSVDSEIHEAMAYDVLDHSTVSANQGIPLRAVDQSSVLGNVPSQPGQTSRLESQFWQSRGCTTEDDFPSSTLNEDELRIGSGDACISDAYSQGLLNNLTQALRSSGVDLTQSSISVQLDVGKRRSTGLPSAMFTSQDHQQNQCQSNQTRTAHGLGSSFDPSDRAEKRSRT